jgi:hypothetical protein
LLQLLVDASQGCDIILVQKKSNAVHEQFAWQQREEDGRLFVFLQGHGMVEIWYSLGMSQGNDKISPM